jgi:hypothetical protein
MMMKLPLKIPIKLPIKLPKFFTSITLTLTLTLTLILILSIFAILAITTVTTTTVEGFKGGGTEGNAMIDPLQMIWPKRLIEDYLKWQAIRNPDYVFDMNIVQKQATVEEVNELFATGYWPWSVEVEELYKKEIGSSFIINADEGSSLQKAKTIYNENAIKELLSYNTKEGSFLLSGVVTGNTKGMPANINNVIRCGSKASMEQVVYKGYDGIDGHLVEEVTPVVNSDLPNKINGFSFLPSRGACNPCVALNGDYSCPFKINVGNGNSTSPIWSMLWKLPTTSISSTTTSTTSTQATTTTHATIDLPRYYGVKNMSY